ncbi:MAG: acetyltransferase [Nitrosospira sp.]|nr:acetyltransferase [Nitrosospira sp.]
MGQLHKQDQCLSAPAKPFICRPDRTEYMVIADSNALLLKSRGGIEISRWRLVQKADQLQLEWMASCSGKSQTAELLAAIEAAFTNYPDCDKLEVQAPFVELVELDELLCSGVLLLSKSGRLTVEIELFWQQARIWLLPYPPCGFPLTYILDHGLRHPLRPPKPEGMVYERYIPWLERTLSFRAVDIQRDLECFNRWMNDPIVAAAWGEEGDLIKHHAYLQKLAADPHSIGLIASLGDEDFGYFEIYWAKEDHIAPFYQADDFDRGWHVLIGEPRFRGKPFVTAWLPSISHYLFLDDCRTQRIVIEPRSDNLKMIRNLGKCGYLNLKEFDFPHKRAILSMLQRERFFAERLWIPRDGTTTSLSASLS